MSKVKYTNIFFPILVAALLFVPWLGEMYFYSKGEPREAIVAVSMLDSGNWILPVSYGGDIPYKPPFLAWLIAIFSLLFNNGHVNEFMSRLPSALAGIALLVMTWRLVAEKCGYKRAWVTMVVLATSFEFFRACSACRVDMLLTFCMVGGIYMLFTMRGRPFRVIYAILLLSGATLTKGPVGTLLPCLAVGIYFLLCRQNFLVTFAKLTLIALASFVLPAIWYYLAYKQGGEAFANLAWEENIGRLTGSMGYESHVNPWHYNVTSVLAGMLPWTIPVLICFFFKKVRVAIKKWWTTGVIKKDNFGFLAWVVAMTTFVFYCIPESKRSVYLLPCYPFMAYGVAWLFNGRKSKRLLSVWVKILAILGIILPTLLIIAECIDFGSLQMDKLSWYQWIVAMIPVIMGLVWVVGRHRKKDGLFGSLMLTYSLLLAYSGAFAPVIMNPRSDYQLKERIEKYVTPNDNVVTYIEADSLMRFYSLNFYFGDRFRSVSEYDATAKNTWLLTDTVAPQDADKSILLTERSADTRRPVYLVSPRNR